MKKIFTLFASFILTISLFAAARPKTTLTIQSYDQSDIRVLIDGRRFEPNTGSMRIRDIQPGYHQVKIYRERRSGLFTIFGQKYDMVYNNSLYLRPQSNVSIIIDRYGRAQVIENRNKRRNTDWDDRSWNNNNDYDFDRGRNYGDYGDRDRDWNDRDGRWDGRNQNGGWGNNNGGYGNNNGGYGNNNGSHGNGDYGNGGYGRQMSDYDFSRALNNISMQRGDYQKAETARQVISSSYFSSIQVKQILQQFSFDGDKLELAKLAYDRTVDRQNFQMVNDVFSSYSSRDELARYIRSH